MFELKPIRPFEPLRSDTIPTGPDWVHQVKWDGVRVLTYYDGSEVKLINRRNNERTMQYPELTDINRYCSADSVILDGEIIALVNGKPSFQEVMKRDRLRSPFSIENAAVEIPIIYMIFDLLYVNGQWTTDLPLQKRQALLTDIIKPQEHVQLVHNFPDGHQLFDVIKAEGMEGILSKHLQKGYAVNGKDKRWLKVKNYLDLYAVIGGVTYRNNVVNSLLLGLYDENRLIYIGHAGTGKLTHEEWQLLTTQVEPLRTEQSPFANLESASAPTSWLTPALTVKIQFMEWTNERLLRQPSIQAFSEKPLLECTFSQT